ncbi:cell wall-active antibiotics response protein LiaF, partial [Enterococcus faecalis]
FFFVFGPINTTRVCFMLIFRLLFIGLKGFEISGVDIAERAPWRKKQMIMVQTGAKERKNGKRFIRRWFAIERIGNNIYE